MYLLFTQKGIYRKKIKGKNFHIFSNFSNPMEPPFENGKKIHIFTPNTVNLLYSLPFVFTAIKWSQKT